uniref:Uncharacterized protein n=1 Tax=Triticum urartu TaxID=4572 RepID=A0A8R7TW88_TRIUA
MVTIGLGDQLVCSRQTLRREQGVGGQIEALPYGLTGRVVDYEVPGVEESHCCVLAPARPALPCRGAIDVGEDQVALTVQGYPGALAVHRRARIRRPDDGLVGGVREPDGEVEGVGAVPGRVEAAGEGGVWRDEQDFL